MALTLGDNFSYLGAKPLDGRVKYDTIADMVAMSASTLYDGILAFCVADGKNYQWKSTNDVDATLGKWRELATGGGGETYSDFTGATESAAGAHGLVPAPSAGDEGKVLFGNGLWGALPSVDLSVLSNEAFQLSATEKAVGMDTDGYLIYSKTIHFTDTVTITNSGTNISGYLPSNIKTYNFAQGYYNGNVGAFLLEKDGDAYCAEETVFNDITIFYTKTTDSPLPSGVKFAGVTSTGEVRYEKTYTGQTTNAQTRAWTTIESGFGTNKRLIGISDGYATETSTGLRFTVPTYLGSSSIVAGIAVVNGDLKIVTEGVEPTTFSVTVRYTLAS